MGRSVLIATFACTREPGWTCCASISIHGALWQRLKPLRHKRSRPGRCSAGLLRKCHAVVALTAGSAGQPDGSCQRIGPGLHHWALPSRCLLLTDYDSDLPRPRHPAAGTEPRALVRHRRQRARCLRAHPVWRAGVATGWANGDGVCRADRDADRPISGHYSRFDTPIMRVMDGMMSFPSDPRSWRASGRPRSTSSWR